MELLLPGPACKLRLLIQRVTSAQVSVDDQVVGSIGPGLVVFVGVREGDTVADASKLAAKVVQLRLFSDREGKMNLSVQDIGGQLLVVSQFTLYAETSKGNRPSYSLAAKPEIARELYESFIARCRAAGIPVETGVFRAHMVVSIVNDGPVTISCQSES
jgi:D-tyrosyl-tRNA(Tyr) deacylase